MVAHATPPKPLREQIARTIAIEIYYNHRQQVCAALERGHPQADSATQDRMIPVFCAHLTASVSTWLSKVYIDGQDCTLALPKPDAQSWIDAAINEAVAAGRCP